VAERLLCAREVAEILGLSVKTVLARFERGDLPGFRLYGRVGAPVRFRASELEATIAGWEAAAPGRGVSQHTAPDAAVRSIVPLANTPGRTRPTTEEEP
jgi:hypothetical protein